MNGISTQHSTPVQKSGTWQLMVLSDGMAGRLNLTGHSEIGMSLIRILTVFS